MKRNPKLFLTDIFESIQLIEEYTEKLNYNQFLENNVTQDAVMRRFEIIGEATKNIPLKIRKEYPEIPWKQMAGMRDMLAHEYFGIAMKRIWDTTQKDLPKLKNKRVLIPQGKPWILQAHEASLEVLTFCYRRSFGNERLLSFRSLC
jgi:uncharacterized protein with HEPN domain